MTNMPEGTARKASRRQNVLLALGMIAGAGLAAYYNTFSVPFLLDDLVNIQTNSSIRQLGSLGSVLSPPNDIGSAGRPILNLTFALNYALGSLSVGSYHVLNLLIHGLAGLTVFGIARITLSLPGFRERYGRAALLLSLAVATLWTLHPIQTESVTYISQRAESLMGLFYLLTLYFFIRAALSSAPAFWAGLSIAACALGMMTKEVMVSAPIIVLLYDRTFIAGTFREAWRRGWRIYLGLAATWLVLAGLIAHSSLESQGVGYSAEFSWWTYALTESKVVVDYLKLALWPHPLVFDYGSDLRTNGIAEAAPYLLTLLALLTLTLVALRRCPALGFLGAWFFLILAPTSSILPVVGQPMAESRMYLPSAAVVTFAILGLYTLAGRKALLAFLLLAIGFGILTVSRNSDYRDEITLWSDTVSKCPGSSRAHYNLGNALAKIPGRLDEAAAHYEAAIKIRPDYVRAHNNLGNMFAKNPDRLQDAIAEYETALKIDPNFSDAHTNLGMALAKIPGRIPEATAHLEAALKIDPNDSIAHDALGNIFAKMPGRMPEAIAHFEAALKIKPDYVQAHNNLGIVLAKLPGRLPEAIAHYEAALKVKPDFAEAHFNLGNALMKAGRSQEAWVHYETAVQLRPDLEPLVNHVRPAQPAPEQRL